MIAEHYLRRWQAAGLIDAAAVARINGWETTHRRPLWLWALSGMGALAIGLGVLAVVAANWEGIPPVAKLAADLLVTALCAILVFVAWRRDRPWPREIGSLLLFGLVIGSLALIGQVYQLQSEPWPALVTWLVLCTPFLALLAFSRLVGTLWLAAAVLTWFAAYDPLEGLLTPFVSRSASGHSFHLLIYLPACLAIVIAVGRSRWPAAEDQAELLLKLALAGLAAAVSTTVVAINVRLAGDIAPVEMLVGACATLLGVMALWFMRGGLPRWPAMVLLGASFLVWTAALLLARARHAGVAAPFDAIFGLLFILYWAAIGWLAARHGQRVVFGLAFTAIGARLLILYFEAIGGLTATGLGLIGGGVLCFVLAWAGWRLTRLLVPGAAS